MAIQIGSRLEPFWDDFLVDTVQSDAERRFYSPVKREKALSLGEPWEGDGCDYLNLFFDDGVYRLYYLGWHMLNDDETEHDLSHIRVCYAESRDGLTWTKPSLGLCEFRGSMENNIILDEKTQKFDNFYVFKDSNPACPPEARYKAITGDHGPETGRIFLSIPTAFLRIRARLTSMSVFRHAISNVRAGLRISTVSAARKNGARAGQSPRAMGWP